jgi:hypothetical protein
MGNWAGMRKEMQLLAFKVDLMWGLFSHHWFSISNLLDHKSNFTY